MSEDGTGPNSEVIVVKERSAPMSLYFDDADPVAECHVKDCRWHGHGDSLNDAVTAWTSHLARDHRGDWECAGRPARLSFPAARTPTTTTARATGNSRPRLTG